MFKQKSSIVDLRFPVGGLNRQSGFDQQPPYTTPFCQNVRPFDSVNLSIPIANMHGMRQRGGARPGLAKAYTLSGGGALGSGLPLQMLGVASAIAADGTVSNILLAVSNGTLYQNASGIFQAVTGGPHFGTTQQLQGTQVGQKYYIADYRTTNLAGTNGSIASNNRLSDASLTDAILDTLITAKDVVWVSNGIDSESNIFSITSVTHGSPGYLTITTGTMTNKVGGVTWQIGRLPKVFDPANPQATLTSLGGSLPFDATSYSVGTVSSAGDGWFVLATGTWAGIPAITAACQLTLTIPNVGGIGTRDYVVESITDPGDPLAPPWNVQLVDSSNDTICTDVPYTLSWTSGFYGLPPLNCPLCCTYRGRLVLAGNYVWYMSRVLDVSDWDYGADPQDPSRAVGGTSTTTGGIPEPLTALIPHSDDYLLFGCERSLWILTADPAYGGTIHALSRDVGVLGTGWCNLPDGSVVFLTCDGLYQVSAGGQSYPQSISRIKLPAELLDVNWSTNRVSMCYDIYARGIHLAITPAAGTAGTHFFIDWATQSFWPVTMPNGLQPTAMVRYSPNSTSATNVMLGGFDGYVRKYSATAITDDDTAINSLVTYGPFEVGGPGYYGELLQINADLDTNGQGASWGVFAGESGQDAIQAAVTAGVASGATWKGTWTATNNHRQFPRAYGAALVIMVSGTYGWAIEGIQIETRRKGLKR